MGFDFEYACTCCVGNSKQPTKTGSILKAMSKLGIAMVPHFLDTHFKAPVPSITLQPDALLVLNRVPRLVTKYSPAVVYCLDLSRSWSSVQYY